MYTLNLLFKYGRIIIELWDIMGNKKSRDKLYFIIVVNTLDTPRLIKFTISGKK